MRSSRPAGPPSRVLLLQALVLALLQGVTGFLPVSSSGHRLGVPYLTGWEPGSPTFDLMVHVGTLAALLWFFRGDLWFLLSRAVSPLVGTVGEQRLARRTLALLAVGSIPAALAGLVAAPVTSIVAGDERLLAIMLYVTALALAGAEWLRRRRVASDLGVAVRALSRRDRRRDPGRHEGTTTPRDAVGVGLAQGLALLPGLSRTGATVAAGMALGLSRLAAVRLSFLLLIPMLLVATLVRLPQLGEDAPGTVDFSTPMVVLGTLVAGLSGLWALRFMLRLAAQQDLLGFARYVAGFATLLLLASYLIIG